MSPSLFVQLIHMTATPVAAAASCLENGMRFRPPLLQLNRVCQRAKRHDCDERQTVVWQTYPCTVRSANQLESR